MGKSVFRSSNNTYVDIIVDNTNSNQQEWMAVTKKE